jgi:hypothetical protein
MTTKIKIGTITFIEATSTPRPAPRPAPRPSPRPSPLCTPTRRPVTFTPPRKPEPAPVIPSAPIEPVEPEAIAPVAPVIPSAPVEPEEEPPRGLGNIIFMLATLPFAVGLLIEILKI